MDRQDSVHNFPDLVSDLPGLRRMAGKTAAVLNLPVLRLVFFAGQASRRRLTSTLYCLPNKLAQEIRRGANCQGLELLQFGLESFAQFLQDARRAGVCLSSTSMDGTRSVPATRIGW